MGYKQACRLNCIEDLCLNNMSLKEKFIFFFASSYVFKLSVEHKWHIELPQVIGRSAAVIHEKPAQDSRNPTFWVPHSQRCECNLLWPSWALDGTCCYLTCNPQSNNSLRKHVTWHNVFVLTSSFMSCGKFLKISQGHSWFHVDLSKPLKVSCWSLKISHLDNGSLFNRASVKNRTQKLFNE